MEGSKSVTQKKADRMLQSARGLLETVNGIVDQYRDRPLKLHASMIQSLGKSLNKAHRLIEQAAKLEAIESEPEGGTGASLAINPIVSFTVLQELLQTWQDLEALVDVIAGALRTDPSKAKATLLDAVSTFAGLSVKYADVAEHVEKEKEKAAEMEANGGSEEWELELTKEFESYLAEKGIDLKGLEETFGGKSQSSPHTTLQQTISQPLETEEDYRYGISPRSPASTMSQPSRRGEASRRDE